MAMSQAILGLDHAVIAVHDLDAARDVYTRLGFSHVPMGNHQNRATANYCIMFSDTYLELLGMNQPELPDYGFKEFLATRGEGFQRLANGTPDADAIAAELTDRGLQVQGPLLLERPQDEPKGMVTFHNVMVSKEQTAGIWTFFCCHRTPDLMRTPAWLRHPNGAVALASVTAVVSDPDMVREALGKVYGAERVKEVGHGLSVDLPRGRVDVTTPQSFGTLHPGAAVPAGPLPRWYAMRIAVADVQATATHLKSQGVEASVLADGSLRLQPADTCGVLMEFVAA